MEDRGRLQCVWEAPQPTCGWHLPCTRTSQVHLLSPPSSQAGLLASVQEQQGPSHLQAWSPQGPEMRGLPVRGPRWTRPSRAGRDLHLPPSPVAAETWAGRRAGGQLLREIGSFIPQLQAPAQNANTTRRRISTLRGTKATRQSLGGGEATDSGEERGGGESRPPGGGRQPAHRPGAHSGSRGSSELRSDLATPRPHSAAAGARALPAASGNREGSSPY